MKRSLPLFILTLASILIITFEVSRAANAPAQRRFLIEEYELFHDVLHPLQYEALPQEDFERIRSTANELVARGKAIVKLGVPRGGNPEFVEARRKFDGALAAFKIDARKGSDARLSKSFTAVHNSFEELADLGPTVYSFHPPPTVSLDCSFGNPESGSQLVVTAFATVSFDANKRKFVWTSSGGKIVDGQGTSKITIDTTGQSGQKISVTVEVNDGNGHLITTSCEVQITASEHPSAVSVVRGWSTGQ